MSSDQELIFSFIIPVLNGGKFVDRCLTHIVKQMRPNDEIIMVDNSSTDNTVELASEYKQVRIVKGPGRTISASRNFGVTMATGNTLAFIDIDCLINEGWRAAAETVLSDKDVDATGSLYDLPETPSWVEKAWWSSRPAEAARTHYMVGGNFVIRKEVFQAVGGFDENLITDEDSDLGARLTDEGYVIVDDPGVGAVHLGNPKTLREFVVKEKWHASSMIDTMKKHGLDKPMAMTLAFMACCLFSVVAAVYSAVLDSRALILLLSILLIPVVTAAYRVFQFRQYRFFFYLTVLYFLFYIVRSITIVELSIKRKTVGLGE